MTAEVAYFTPLRSTRHHSARAYRDLTDWLASLRLKGRADRTLDDYERTIAALLDWKDMRSSDYTVSDLEHFILVRYGATPGARVRISHLNSFFGWLHKRERILRNPAALLEPPAGHRQKVVETFTESELALIYAADPLAVLLCETGIRKSEARRLQRRHVNLITDELIVYAGKGNKDRVIPLTSRASQTVAQLELTEGLNPEDHFWWTKPGGGKVIRRRDAISDTAMHRWWAAPADDRNPGVLARAGVTYRNMHVTRHTFATRLIRRGARLENVQKLLGHSSIQTTVDVYGHLSVEDARADLALLELA